MFSRASPTDSFTGLNKLDNELFTVDTEVLIPELSDFIIFGPFSGESVVKLDGAALYEILGLEIEFPKFFPVFESILLLTVILSS